MNLQSLDLNLLKVFEAVYRARNLTDVALQMHLTQPAISHALRRLRISLGDPLFVRTINGLEPTLRSEQLIKPIRDALQLIDDSVFSSGNFEPQHCTREFRLLLSDVGELVFLPRLLRDLRSSAPAAEVIALQASRTEYDSLLRDRAADIAIGHLPDLPSSLKYRPLFRDDYVVMRARKFPQNETQISLTEYISAVHIDVDPPGTLRNQVDSALKVLGLQRNVGLRVPHFFSVPSVLLQTDLMVTVPRSVASNIRNSSELLICNTPFEMPLLHVSMYWHVRQDADPAHLWLRELMVKLFASKKN